MQPILLTEAYRRIIACIELGENPLGLTEGEIADHAEIVDAVNLALDGMDRETAERVAAALSHHYAKKLWTHPVEPVDDHALRDAGALDRITAGLIAHMGIDPLKVAWLAHICRGVDLMDRDTLETRITVSTTSAPGRANNATIVHLSPTAIWHGEGVIGIDDGIIPETVATACIGRPLREVFTHPVFDAHDFVIARIDNENDRTWIDVTADMRALSPGDLLGIAPFGCR